MNKIKDFDSARAYTTNLTGIIINGKILHEMQGEKWAKLRRKEPK